MNVLKNIAHVWRLLNAPCRDMARLASRAMDERLSFWERFAYRLHLVYCSACRKYQRQLRFIRRAFDAAEERLADVSTPGLSDEARARIAKRIKSADG